MDIELQLIVVDNGSSDNTKAVASAYKDTLNLQYLFEGRPGKCHALNRALTEVTLGEIVAFLDDDMTLEPGWLRAVIEGCRRWTDYDVFSGRSTVVLPRVRVVPSWAHRADIAGWAFSVVDAGPKDHAMAEGFYPSGNHFWVRAKVFEGNRRFPDLKILSDAAFVLGLYEDGYRGMWIGDAMVRHRIQPHLLDPARLFQRMQLMGRESPYAWLPHQNLSWRAQTFRNRRLLCTLRSMCSILRWSCQYVATFFMKDVGDQLLSRLIINVRLFDHLETVRHGQRIRAFIESNAHRGPTGPLPPMARVDQRL